MKDLKSLSKDMTVSEKAGLCSGKDFWKTKEVDRLGIPDMMMSDGPHGLRKQDYSEGDRLGINDSIKATCFPTGVGIAASFDRELAKELGNALGNEAAAENLSVLLGPAINIKRSPLCGRNFEYMTEDPYLAGELATAYTKAVQSYGVGVSVKHFAANNQEHHRCTNSSEVDERTLREIYFPAFEKVVKEANPWTIMCAYNMLNGEFCSENKWLLTDVLRKEWGFKGFVVSDWGAVNDRVKGLVAGLDLEMPSSAGPNDNRIRRAVESGEVPEEILDTANQRILTVLYDALDQRKKAVYDRDKDHELARKIASQTMVLLKNDNVLPLSKDKKYAVIGQFAKEPRIQGGGSSHINTDKITSFLDAATDVTCEYCDGWNDESIVDEKVIQNACEVAKRADIALLFIGLTNIYESEGYDRANIELPPAHNALVDAITKVNPNTIVVLHNGSPVAMPWVDKVKGILEAYLAGEASGGAVYDILFGHVNPSAKLAETFPLKDEDVPCNPYFPGYRRCVEYREGLYVGYRYYDKAKQDVLFPFGYGLSYTSFEYSELKVSKENVDINKESFSISFKVKNTGKVFGGEAVQIYVKDIESTAYRPEKELKGFEKVWLNPGEEKTVEITLDKRAFAFYNMLAKDWTVESGEFEILVGASSQDIKLSKLIGVVGDNHKILDQSSTLKSYYSGNIKSVSDEEFLALSGKKELYPREYSKDHIFDMNNNFGDVKDTRFGRLINYFIDVNAKMQTKGGAKLGSAKVVADMAKETPLRATINFSRGLLTKRIVKGMLLKFNATGKGFKGFLQTIKGSWIIFTSLLMAPRNHWLGNRNRYDERDERRAEKKRK